MGKPLGIPLGINFDALDRDLNKVADRIEAVGKSASISLGAGTRDLAGGNIDPDRLGASVESVGIRLSQGISNGIRGASTMMLAFASRINAMLDRLVGAAVTMFQRIDASMKFPKFDAFFATVSARLTNFALWSKPMTVVDTAVAGGFGRIIQNVTMILKTLLESLATTISNTLRSAVVSVAAEFAKMNQNVVQTEASAQLLYTTSAKTAAAVKSAAVGGGLKTSIGGPRIGAKTDFMAPVPEIKGVRPQIDILKSFAIEAAAAWKALHPVISTVGTIIGTVASDFVRTGALMVGVAIRIYTPFARLRNFLSSLGDVGKKSYAQIYESHGIVLGSLIAVTRAAGRMFGIFKDGSGTVAKSAEASRTSIGQMSGAVMSLGRQLLLAFGVVGLAFKVVQFFKDGIAGAAALNDTVKVSKEIFGDSFGDIGKQADAISKKYGIMRNEQIKIANQFGAMAQGAGYTEKESSKLANTMTELTLNFAQTWSLPFEEAAEKVRGGLAGQGRGLKQYGVFIDDTTVKSNALADGMATMAATASRTAGSASSSMKKMPKGFSSVETVGKVSRGGGKGTTSIVVARDVGMMERAKIIMDGLTYTTGALERASGGASAQFRKAGGGVGEFGVRIGEILLPAVQMGTEAFNTLLSAVIDVFDTHQDTIKGWVEYITNAMKKVAFVARNLGDVWQIVQLRIGEFVINSVAQIQAIADNWGPIWDWIRKNWLGLLEDMMFNFLQFGKNLGTMGMALGKAIWEALSTGEFKFDFNLSDLTKDFQKTTEELPAMIEPKLISVSDEVNKIWDDIQKKEDKLKETPFGVAPKKPGEAKEPAKAADYKLASVVEIGSKEAYSILAKSQSLGRGATTGEKTVSLLGQSVQVQRELLNEQKKKKAEFRVAT